MSETILSRVRERALALPHATERLSHGSPAWFVGKAPMFASYADHHHGVDWIALWAAAPPGVAESLIAADPAVYFRPPYVGGRGWVGMRLDEDTDPVALEDLLEAAWETVAPARYRAEGR